MTRRRRHFRRRHHHIRRGRCLRSRRPRRLGSTDDNGQSDDKADDEGKDGDQQNDGDGHRLEVLTTWNPLIGTSTVSRPRSQHFLGRNCNRNVSFINPLEFSANYSSNNLINNDNTSLVFHRQIFSFLPDFLHKVKSH